MPASSSSRCAGELCEGVATIRAIESAALLDYSELTQRRFPLMQAQQQHAGISSNGSRQLWKQLEHLQQQQQQAVRNQKGRAAALMQV